MNGKLAQTVVYKRVRVKLEVESSLPGVVVNGDDAVKEIELLFSEGVLLQKGVKVVKLSEVVRLFSNSSTFKTNVVEQSVIRNEIEFSVVEDPLRLVRVGVELEVSWIHSVLK